MKSLFAVVRYRFLLLFLLATAATSAAAKPYVCLQTNVGEICMELLPDVAPRTVENFLHYVDDGDYSDSMIHRSVPGFVIQGGGYKVFSNLIAQLQVDPPVVNESRQSNLRGTVAMARTSDVNSATSQWFINLVDNTSLDGTAGTGYTVFARVVKGMDVADSIAALTRFNQVSTYGAAFGEVPALAAAGTTVIPASEFIRVVRAFRTDFIEGVTPMPYQCSVSSPNDTLTEFCGSSLSFPVLVNGVLYEGTLVHVPGRSGLVFRVDTSKLKLLTDTTATTRATFSGNVLTIPSVRSGARVFDNVKLNLTSSSPLEFTLATYTER